MRTGLPTTTEEWWTGSRPNFEHNPVSRYTIAIRSDVDPERSSREERRAKLQAMGLSTEELTNEVRRLAKADPEVWVKRITQVLNDGDPRTLNRISLELLDKTADITMDTAFRMIK
jgi:hypothetical protein